MARDRSAIGKQSRREGIALHPKAHKLLVKKGYAPGQHGQSRRFRRSEYGEQLREKQKIRRMYGLLEKQFRNLMTEAMRSKGKTGDKMIELLESRVDNVVYRSGLATSRRAARQLVSHGHFTLNSKKHGIPSAKVKVGDILEVREKSKKTAYFKDGQFSGGEVPAWIKFNAKSLKIEVVADPKREMVDDEINEGMVVEFYSRLI